MDDVITDSLGEEDKIIEQGVKLTFFPGSHLAPKYFKVVANSKKLVAMTHTKPFLPCHCTR